VNLKVAKRHEKQAQIALPAAKDVTKPAKPVLGPDSTKPGPGSRGGAIVSNRLEARFNHDPAL
jgi:hypothetical protein